MSQYYTQLNPAKVFDTVVKLKGRIADRFPESSLSRVCAELEQVTERCNERIQWIARPIWPLRILRYLLLLVIVAGVIITFVGLRPSEFADLGMVDWIQTLEAGINDVVLIGIAVFFVWTLESRVKRRRAMRALHELRSLAHVIDMHQLTKDPDRLEPEFQIVESSPRPKVVTAFALRRYLDYCSEMLSLVSKVAALHLQTLDDSTVVATVNEIEDLTSGLSRKIWQKIDMLRHFEK